MSEYRYLGLAIPVLLLCFVCGIRVGIALGMGRSKAKKAENEMYDFPPFETSGEESGDPEVIQHIKPENRTAKEREILEGWSKVKKDGK